MAQGCRLSPKYQKIHFNEFHDKIIVANIFHKKNMKIVAQGTGQRGCFGPDVTKFPSLLYAYNFF